MFCSASCFSFISLSMLMPFATVSQVGMLNILTLLIAGIIVPLVSVYFAARFAIVDAWRQECRTVLLGLLNHWQDHGRNAMHYLIAERSHSPIAIDEQYVAGGKYYESGTHLECDKVALRMLFGTDANSLLEHLQKGINDLLKSDQFSTPSDLQTNYLTHLEAISKEVEGLEVVIRRRSIFSWNI